MATEQLPKLADGRVLYRLRHQWRDGTSHVIFNPLDLIGKLAALVPPPRFNVVRYHGTLALSSRWRSSIVLMPLSDGEDAGSRKHTGCIVKNRKKDPDGKDGRLQKASHPRNYSWAADRSDKLPFAIAATERKPRPFQIRTLVLIINPLEMAQIAPISSGLRY